MRLGIDLDGVLADFVTAFREVGEDMLGRELLTPSEWNLTSMGISQEELDAIWRKASSIQNFWAVLDRLPGTDRMGDWLNLQHDVYFITARKETAGYPVHVQSAIWLASEFDIQFPRVILAKEKGPVARGLKLDAYIDDCVELCEEVARDAPGCKVYLKSTDYNKSYSGPIERVKSFDQFISKALKAAVTSAP